MISIDAVLFKINIHLGEGDIDGAIDILENAIEDDLVNSDDEKELSVKYLQLLLRRRSDSDVQNFKEFASKLKKEDYSPRMTESIYSLVSHLLTFTDTQYGSDEYNRYKEILSWDTKSPFPFVLSLSEISISAENPEDRLSKQIELYKSYVSTMTEDEKNSIDNYLSGIKSQMATKQELNSNDKRALEFFYVLGI